MMNTDNVITVAKMVGWKTVHSGSYAKVWLPSDEWHSYDANNPIVHQLLMLAVLFKLQVGIVCIGGSWWSDDNLKLCFPESTWDELPLAVINAAAKEVER